MRYLLSFVFLACSLCLQAQSFIALDKKYGFRDTRFETDISAYPDMVLSSQDANTRTYQRQHDTLTIADARLEYISYTFFQGKLATVVLRTANTGDTQALIRALEAAYGRSIPGQTRRFHREWSGMKVHLSMESYLDGGASVYMSSRAMEKAIAKDEKQRAKNANL